MKEIHSLSEVQEMKKTDVEGLTKISPELKAKFEEAKTYVQGIFSRHQDAEIGIDKESLNKESLEKLLEKLLNNYSKELKSVSDCPETLDKHLFCVSDIKRISPEQNASMREEFNAHKSELKTAWEKKYNRPWPKYDHDIYSNSGKLIRRKGDDYDAHHIHPLGLGGKNDASNITPLRAEVHYDKQGVHSPDSPCSKIEKIEKLYQELI